MRNIWGRDQRQRRPLMMTIIPQAKICSKCNIEKPIDMFRPTSHGRGIGGKRADCRACECKRSVKYSKTANGKEKIRDWLQTDKGREKQYRDNHSPTGRARTKRYWQTAKAREGQKQRDHERRETRPEVIAAYNAIKKAVRDGVMPTISTKLCQHCNEQARHYHHWSYEQEHQLDVIPLCASCHKVLHTAIP